MSRISEISRQYHAALSASQQQYEQLYHERAEATEAFYSDFFHRLVSDFRERFGRDRFRAKLQERIEQATGTRNLQFIAVDGTCRNELFADMITFFGGAYGARGEVAFTGGEHKIRYKRWSLDQDVSMVAWVPVPFARLEEVAPGHGEQFLMTEEERINLAAVHIQVMQLAEVFLAYNSIRSSRLDAPHILLMDLLPSSVLASTSQRQEDIGLVGYPYDRRALTAADLAVALAHPFNEQLGVPTTKKMDFPRLILAQLHRQPSQPVDLDALAARHGLTREELRPAAERLVQRGVLKSAAGQRTYPPAVNVQEAWAYCRDFFQNICTRLFLQKDPAALQYDAPDARGVVRRRWMAPGDLSFLIAVGMRLLIEECWARKILYYGVVKDSTARSLTRNFLGVSYERGFHPDLRNLRIGMLPWTDRIFCETLPLIDERLSAPWCTIEFDAAFMTLHRERLPGGGTRIGGVSAMGGFVNQERLFARSLAQFFLKRNKSTPLMGHVVFLERLLSPIWDWPGKEGGPAEILVDTPALGRFSVFAWRDQKHLNPGQWVMMYLLSVLTKNHYAEAIGYPDPLHKADWGAKTIGRSVADTVRSSTHLLAARPLSRTFRAIRAARRRS
jgi:hypothetical protein